MAEVIELRREQSIREYECMKHLKLFTDDEIGAIKTKRFNLEYKVERKKKNLADFISYIEYENNFLKLLHERRQKLHIKHERLSLEVSVRKRIRVLYTRAITRFPHEYRLWVHYLGNCQKRREIAAGSRALDKMLNFHGEKPKAWINAMNWEYRQAKNMARAKHYTFRGLQRHPENSDIHLTFIDMQMAEALAIAKQSNEPVEELMSEENVTLCKALDTATLVYENYAHKDVDFFRQLLGKLKKYRPLSSRLAQSAIQEMQTILAHDEQMWNLLASLALEGNDFLLDNDDEKPPTFKQRLDRCIDTFRTAIEKLPTKKMYALYIETMLKLNDVEQVEQRATRKALAKAFRETLLSDQLDEQKLVQYLKLLLHNETPNEELVMNVIDKGLQQCPESIDFWILYLRYLTRKEVDAGQVERMFQQASKSLPDNINQLPLWKALFQYYHSRPHLPGKMEQMFRRAVQQEPSISHHFQPLYLDFLLATKNSIAAVRTEYLRLVKNFTTTLEVHQKMASLEAAQPQPNVTEWRKCLEQATHFYGKSNSTVWLEYIQFELEHGTPRNVHALYERAKGTLEPESFADFLPQYELLKNPLI
ncbi:U3 small nucleolar RNA-associated protein 6 homolog [Anopheles bellator]|uniref:U3 small nucleolar RNA-associated protein 6 homolog n=1 Tax=Anopheles bellator TaxID=139047 RepID=UPI0026480192|nr:U3 small nucleolar RNA-associated protein 6 homolog [Anopheles bellator]